MTLSGTVNKSFMLVAIVLAGAIWSWQNAYSGTGWGVDAVPVIPPWYFAVMIGVFILGLVIIFKKEWAPFLAPVYAIGQGLSLGTLSAVFDYKYPGIAFQAVLCTFGVFISLLMIYKTGLIKATENFKLGVACATFGVLIVYLIDFVLMFFGYNVPFIHEGGPLGIAVSAVIVVIAALNLVLDFDFIENGARHRAPKYMEWYAAFGLLMTLIWLYLEILRLLAKTRKK